MLLFVQSKWNHTSIDSLSSHHLHKQGVSRFTLVQNSYQLSISSRGEWKVLIIGRGHWFFLSFHPVNLLRHRNLQPCEAESGFHFWRWKYQKCTFWASLAARAEVQHQPIRAHTLDCEIKIMVRRRSPAECCLAAVWRHRGSVSGSNAHVQYRQGEVQGLGPGAAAVLMPMHQSEYRSWPGSWPPKD